MFQGGKFLRGRKYSVPISHKEKRKSNESIKISAYNHLKKLNKNSKNIMMLNISGDLLSQGYEGSGNNRLNISKPSTSSTR